MKQYRSLKKLGMLTLLPAVMLSLTACYVAPDEGQLGRYVSITQQPFSIPTQRPTEVVTQAASLPHALPAQTTQAATQPVTSAFIETPPETPGCSSSTVAAQVQAPDRVKETLSSNTGKVIIELDATVTVPEASSVRVYQCVPRLFSEAELLAMARACFGARPYTGEERLIHTHRNIDKNNTIERDEYTMSLEAVARVSNPGSSLAIPSHRFVAHMNVLMDGTIDWAQAFFEYYPLKGDVYFWPNVVSVRNPTETAAGCSVTRTQAREMADAAIAAFAPDFTCVAQVAGNGEIQGSEGRDGSLQFSEEEAWFLFYTRRLELPVAYDSIHPNDGYSLIAPHESIIFIINDKGIQSAYYNAPLAITGVLQDNCTLLPFEQIMAVARSLLPLKYASQEAGWSELHYTVYEIALSYMRVRSKNTPNAYEFVPVWDFYCGAQQGRKKDGTVSSWEGMSMDSLLTINAIDGTVIDRAYGY